VKDGFSFARIEEEVSPIRFEIVGKIVFPEGIVLAQHDIVGKYGELSF
jgi:hypothetical protein